MTDGKSYWDLRADINEALMVAFKRWHEGLSERARSAIGGNDTQLAGEMLTQAMAELVAERDGFDPVTGGPLETDEEGST